MKRTFLLILVATACLVVGRINSCCERELAHDRSEWAKELSHWQN
jgi:hypothetical protein